MGEKVGVNGEGMGASMNLLMTDHLNMINGNNILDDTLNSHRMAIIENTTQVHHNINDNGDGDDDSILIVDSHNEMIM